MEKLLELHNVKVLPTVELINHTSTPLHNIMRAIRICKNSISRMDTVLDDEGVREILGAKDAEILMSCLANGHESVLEHVSLTVRLHLSRVAQQHITRHRLASPSVESARAIRKSSPTYFIPPTIHTPTNRSQIYLDALLNATQAYNRLIADGVSIEDARYVLPLALMQPMIFTANLREWRWIVAERCCIHAQYETRILVSDVREIIRKIHPILLAHAWRKECPELAKCGKCRLSS